MRDSTIDNHEGAQGLLRSAMRLLDGIWKRGRAKRSRTDVGWFRIASSERAASETGERIRVGSSGGQAVLLQVPPARFRDLGAVGPVEEVGASQTLADREHEPYKGGRSWP